MKKIIFFLFFTLLEFTLNASVKINGLYYDLYSDNKTATITYKSSNSSLNKTYVSGALTIPPTVKYEDTEYTVTVVGESAFKGCVYLTSIEIPSSVIKIDDKAFSECSQLITIDIPNSVKSIGSKAFSNCSGLTSITLPDNLSSIEAQTFYYCNHLTSINIPGSVKSVGENAFTYCKSLKEVKFQDNDEAIKLGCNVYQTSGGFGLFSDCPLESVYLGRDIEYSLSSSSSALPWTQTPRNYGYSAFYDIRTLTSVSIGSKVKELHKHIFRNCSQLKFVKILSDSNISIGEYAFYGCKSLSSFEMYKSVSDIGTYAFYNCSSLSSIDISGLEDSHILSYAFYNCSSLSCIKIPDSVKYIFEYAFYGCKSLTSVNIPNSVITIDESSFENCSGILEFIIPPSVYSIGRNALLGINPKAKIIYSPGGGLQGLDKSTDTSSVELLITDKSKTLEACISPYLSNFQRIFYYEDNHKYYPILWSLDINFQVNGAVYTQTNGCLVDKDNFVIKSENPVIAHHFDRDISEIICSDNGYSFTPKEHWRLNTINLYNLEDGDVDTVHVKVAGTLFETLGLENIQKLTKLNISGYLNGTDIMTINRMTKLVYLNIKDATIVEGGQTYRSDLKTKDNVIGSEFFYYLTKLETVILPSSATKIDKRAFLNNTSINNIILGDNIESIDESSFSGCSSILSLVIPEKVKSIGNNAFEACSSLMEMIFKDGRENIELGIQLSPSYNREVGLFSDCPLMELHLGRNIVYAQQPLLPKDWTESPSNYGYSAFNAKRYLQSLTLGEQLISIPDYLFQGCSKISYVQIPNAVTSIGNYAFSGCAGLNSIELPVSLTSIGEYSFGGCSDLTTINLPKTISSIGAGAFSECSGLTSFDIPTTITFLPNNIFYNCSGLNSMEIPSSITSIGNKTFYGCSGISTIQIPDNVISIGSEAFRDCSNLSSVIFGNSVNIIDKYAFYGCKMLKTIDIPNSVTSLGSNVFNSCDALEEVRLGRNLKFIGEEGFGSCYGITRIVSLNNTPPEITAQAFTSKVLKSSTLVIPKGSLVYYWLDPVWKEFLNMVENIYYLEDLPNVQYGDDPLDLTKFSPDGIEISYESSNPEIAYIDGNLLKIAGAGNTSIKANFEKTDDSMELMGQTRQFVVGKKDLTIEVLDIEIEEGCEIPQFNLIGSGFVYGESLEDLDERPVVTCEASLESSPGKYPIILTGGKSKNYNITLKNGTLTIKETSIVYPQSITLNINEISLTVGDILQLEATVLPENATNKTLTWKSNNEEIATVSDLGLVKGISEGKAEITVSCGSASACCKVNVRMPSTDNDDSNEPSKPEDPGNDNPGNDNPGNDDPGNDEPGNDDPGNDNPGNDNPGNDNPGNDDPGNDDPGNDDPGNDNPGNDEPGNDNPGNDEPGNDNPGNDNPGNDNPGNDNPGNDNPGNDNPGNDNPGEDNPDTGVDNIDAEDFDFIITYYNITLNGANGMILYDLNGRVVNRTNGSVLWITNLPKGVYVVKSGRKMKKFVR